MASQFLTLIELIEAGHVAELTHVLLRLTCMSSLRTRALAETLESGSLFPITLFQSGQEVFGGAREVQDGQPFEIHIGRVTQTEIGIWRNLSDMLTWQDGRFLSQLPKHFYLVDESYRSDEVPSDQRVAGYLRIPALLELLEQASDARYEVKGRDTFVVVAGKKVSIPVLYAAEDLPLLAPVSLIENAREAVLSSPQRPEKLELFKRVLVRTLQDVEQDRRFARIVVAFQSMAATFEADRDHYVSEFSFERLRETFERKKLDYMLKVDAAVGDLVGKVLAIPIGQAVIVSQYEDGHNYANFALLLGALFFTTIGILVFFSHLSVLKELRAEIKAERDATEKKHPELFDRVKAVFEPLLRRSIIARVIAWFVLFLMVVGMLVSIAGWIRIPSTCEVFRGRTGWNLPSCAAPASDTLDESH